MTRVVFEMRADYRREDFGTGVRGKYFERILKGTNLVLLDDQVANLIPITEAVNQEDLPRGPIIDLLHTATIAAQKERKHGKREGN